jgi:hypothetical protein
MADRKRRAIIVGILAAVALAVVAIAAWRAMNPPLPAPAQAVQSLLELRRDRSTDASAYARYFAEPDLALALAQAASSTAEATSSAFSPIPQWKPLYVSAQASGTADVVVVWKPSPRFKQWARATVFRVEETSGLWKIVNAVETTSTPPPALGAAEATKVP